MFFKFHDFFSCRKRVVRMLRATKLYRVNRPLQSLILNLRPTFMDLLECLAIVQTDRNSLGSNEHNLIDERTVIHLKS